MVVIEILCPCVSWCTPMASSRECSNPSCDSYLSLRAVISSSFHCFYSHFRWYWSSCHNVKGYVIYTVWAPQISLFCIFYLQDIVRSLIYEWMWHLLKPHFSYCKYIRNTCIVMCESVIRSFVFVIRYTKKQC